MPDSVLLRSRRAPPRASTALHVRRKRSVDVEARVVRLELTAERGEPLVAQGERAQEAVAAALKQACDLDVAVDVAFEELA